MPELITAIEQYALWLYLLLGLLFLWQLSQLVAALRARRSAVFRVEADAATGRLARALVTMLLLVVLAFGVNTVATVVAPALPPEIRRRIDDRTLVEPTRLAPLPTATDTPLPHTPTPRPARIVTATPGPSPTSTQTP